MNTPALVSRMDPRALPQWNAAAPGYLGLQSGADQEASRQATRLGQAARRYWWVVVLIWALVAIPWTLAVYKTVRPKYVAVSQISIAPVIINPLNNAKDPNPFYSEYLRTQAELMKNPYVLQKAAADRRLTDNFAWFRGLSDQVKFLSDNVQVFPVASTQNIQISMAHEDAAAAKAVVDSVMDAYFATKSDMESKNGQESLDLLKKMLATTDDQLKKDQEQLTKLTSAGDTSWTEQDRKVVADVLAGARLTVNKLTSDQIALKAQLKNLEARKLPEPSLYLASVTTDNDPQVSQWVGERNKLGMLDAELASKKATTQHPERVAYRQQMKVLDEKIAARRKELQDTAWTAYKASFDLRQAENIEKVNADLDAVNQQIADLNTHVGEQEVSLKEMGSKVQPIASLREQIADGKEAKKRLTSRIEEVESQNQAAGRVWEKGTQTVQPKTPTIDTRPKYAMMANGVGFMLGLATLVLIVKLRDKIDHPEDLPNGFQPLVVGTVSHAGAAARGLQGRMSKKILGEEMRLLHANLLPPGPMTRRIMMITSPTPANGKTSIASQLALSLAKSGLDVLLIDADLRKRDLSTMFDVGFRPGLADLLQGKAPELIRPVELLPNLRLMGAGSKLDRNPVELFQRKHFHESLNLLQDKFDCIVVDTPPTLVVADARLIARSCDEVLCVVRAQVSSPKDVNQTIDALTRITGKTPKIIVNGVAHRQAYYKYKFAYASHEDDAETAASAAGHGPEGAD